MSFIYKRLPQILLIIPLFLFTSCFEFIEEVSFNKDGSGSITLTVNLSKSKNKLASIMLLDSINGHKVPSKVAIRKKVTEVVNKIEQTKGVHNVKNTLDFDEFIVVISCDFDNVEALNTVISNFSSQKDAMAIRKHKHFKFDETKKVFVRSHHFNFSKEMEKTKMKDREILKTASYTSIYRFEFPIKEFENKSAKVSKNKKAIMLRANAQDIINNQITIKNYIQLDN